MPFYEQVLAALDISNYFSSDEINTDENNNLLGSYPEKLQPGKQVVRLLQ